MVNVQISEPAVTTLILTGPYAGATRMLQGWKFVEGVCRLDAPPSTVEGIIKYMGRCYQAYLKGSPELAEALERSSDGQLPIDGAPGDRATGAVPGDVQSDGDGSGPSPADDGGSDDVGGGGDQGVPAAGDGELRTEVEGSQAEEPAEGEAETEAQKQKLREVIALLDPEQDDHWTRGGKPSVAKASSYAGRNITRAMIEEAAPGVYRKNLTVEATPSERTRRSTETIVD